MSNSVSNSSLDNNSGSIHVGNITINLSRYEEYNKLNNKLELKTNERKNLEFNIQNLGASINGENKALEEAINLLEKQAFSIEAECQEIRDNISQFITTLTKTLTSLLHDNSKSERIEEIKQLIETGNTALANEKLNLEEILLRRNSLLELSSTIVSNLPLIARELALKAKTALLQVDDKKRYEIAYNAYKESINTCKVKEIFLEYIDFLYEYNIEESIQAYKDFLLEFKNHLTKYEEAEALKSLAFEELQNHKIHDSYKHYEESLSIFVDLDKSSIVKDISTISCIIECNNGLAHVHFHKHEMEKVFTIITRSFDLCKFYDDNVILYLRPYWTTVEIFIDCLLRTRTEKGLNDAVHCNNRMLRLLLSEKDESDSHKEDLATWYKRSGNLLSILGQFDEANQNLKKAEELLSSLSKYRSGTIKIMIAVKMTFSNLYRIKKDIRSSIYYLFETINLAKTLINVSKLEAENLIVSCNIEIATLERRRKDHKAYLNHKIEALNHYINIYKEWPNHEIHLYFNSFKELIPSFFSNKYAHDYLVYINSLVTFFERRKQYTEDVEMLTLLIADAYNSSGLVYKYLLKEVGKSNEIFVKVINLVGDKIIDDDYRNKIRNLAIKQILDSGIDRIELNGRIVTIEKNPGYRP